MLKKFQKNGKVSRLFQFGKIQKKTSWRFKKSRGTVYFLQQLHRWGSMTSNLSIEEEKLQERVTGFGCSECKRIKY